MAEKPARIRIGYALSPKKVQSFIQQSLLDHAAERGIDLFPLHFSKPLHDQGPIDCIIHKLSSPDWINQLQQFASKNPSVVVIDNPAGIQRLRNRLTMLEVVHQISVPRVSLSIPKQVFVESPQPAVGSLLSDGIDFPVIAKPFVSDGSADSHQMSLVFNEEGLKSLKLDPPFVLQEFVNHGGVIFKVYVAGRHVQCVKRKSLPDIPSGGFGLRENSMLFSQISNVTADDQSDENMKMEMPQRSFVNEVACQLREALKLNLFNFDMIRDVRFADKYLVIDINYFPGYAKLPCYENFLTDFFLDIVKPVVREVA